MTAEQREQFLENLPTSLPQQIQALRPYEFLDSQAAQAFQELLDELQKQAMRSQMNGRSSPSDGSAMDDMQAQHEMYRDLNQQMRQKAQGQPQDFQQFQEQHPEFPSAQDGNLEEINPKTQRPVTVEELLDYARNYLRVDYIFWGMQEPYYSRDVLPALARFRTN